MSKTVLSKIGTLLLPLIISVFCSFPAYAQTEKTLTIEAKAIALEKVMQQIEKQTNCVFLNKDVDVQEKVSVSISGFRENSCRDPEYLIQGQEHQLED